MRLKISKIEILDRQGCLFDSLPSLPVFPLSQYSLSPSFSLSFCNFLVLSFPIESSRQNISSQSIKPEENISSLSIHDSKERKVLKPIDMHPSEKIRLTTMISFKSLLTHFLPIQKNTKKAYFLPIQKIITHFLPIQKK